MFKTSRLVVSFCCLVFTCLSLQAADTPPSAAIASAHPLATEAGMATLEKGGNAFDAAVTVTATLAVVEPYSSGLGGGGFWLLHFADSGKNIMVDGREKAPGAAHKDLYLNEQGEVISGLSITGPLAAGIPGTPAAMVHLAEKYGKLSLKESLAPAIRLARDGFAVDEKYRRLAGFRLEALQKDKTAASLFLKDNDIPPLGHTVVQKDLASVLRNLARKGSAGFYHGRVADVLVEGVREAGGIWSKKDLENYKVVEREPVVSYYRGHKIIAASPPSSGGIALATMFNILEDYPLSALEPAQRKHIIVEAMRRAYRDRAEYLGDPDFVNIPVKMLTAPMYAKGLKATIHWSKATPSALLPGPVSKSGKGTDTTHFSILDKNGNRVAATLSINYPFGACFVPPRTGILLNDEMDDFVSKPGVPNAYGLVGADANAIEPGKRPLSSMTPTFVEGPDSLAVLGTPGGSRIITMVLLGILSYVDGNRPEQWTALPRFHHQYLPDQIQYEETALTNAEIETLKGFGHKLEPLDYRYGNMQAVLWDKKQNKVFAASDDRGVGKAAVR